MVRLYEKSQANFPGGTISLNFAAFLIVLACFSCFRELGLRGFTVQVSMECFREHWNDNWY